MSKQGTLKVNEEEAIAALSRLYALYGYTPYKMRKFEEYDLYVQNKSFLVSSNILTFTDASGKLMALKPDVTLSIVRNSKEGQTSKVFYNEKVYRPDKNNRAFKEITQLGLECIGIADAYAICEVLTLALSSLEALSDDCMLDVSSLDILSLALDKATKDEKTQEELLVLIRRKAEHDLRALCSERGVDEENTALLSALCCLEGAPSKVLPTLEGLCGDEAWKQAVGGFSSLLSLLPEKHLRVDFSATGDRNYYNGVVFRGYLNGIPESFLSGGQYDKLMEKLGKKAPALGFAVYLDEIERLCPRDVGPDVDVLLLYDGKTPPAELLSEVKKLTAEGKKVLASPTEGKTTYLSLIDKRMGV